MWRAGLPGWAPTFPHNSTLEVRCEFRPLRQMKAISPGVFYSLQALHCCCIGLQTHHSRAPRHYLAALPRCSPMLPNVGALCLFRFPLCRQSRPQRLVHPDDSMTDRRDTRCLPTANPYSGACVRSSRGFNLSLPSTPLPSPTFSCYDQAPRSLGPAQSMDLVSEAMKKDLLNSVMAAAAEPGVAKLDRNWRGAASLQLGVQSIATPPMDNSFKGLSRVATPTVPRDDHPYMREALAVARPHHMMTIEGARHNFLDDSRSRWASVSRSGTPMTTSMSTHGSCTSLASLAPSPPLHASVPAILYSKELDGQTSPRSPAPLVLPPAIFPDGRQMVCSPDHEEDDCDEEGDESMSAPTPRLVRDALPHPGHSPPQRLIVIPGASTALPNSTQPPDTSEIRTWTWANLAAAHPCKTRAPLTPRSHPLLPFSAAPFSPLLAVAPLRSGCADGLMLLSCTATVLDRLADRSYVAPPPPKRSRHE